MTSLGMVLVGAMLLTALVHSREDREEDADSFLLVGAMMGLFICGVSLLGLLSHALDFYLIHKEDLVGWSVLQDLSPSIVLGLPSALVLRSKLREILRPNAPTVGRDRLINEILQMVAGGSSVREIADKFGLTTDSVLARLLTMERMGLLSIEDRTVPVAALQNARPAADITPPEAIPADGERKEAGQAILERLILE